MERRTKHSCGVCPAAADADCSGDDGDTPRRTAGQLAPNMGSPASRMFCMVYWRDPVLDPGVCPANGLAQLAFVTGSVGGGQARGQGQLAAGLAMTPTGPSKSSCWAGG